MKKKVYLDPGHGGSDPGAVKYITEKTAALETAKACRDLLTLYDVEIKMSRSGDMNKSLNTRTAEANRFGADYYVSIHYNAGGGDGAEVYHTIGGGTGRTLAQNILKEIQALGQQSRGAKTRLDSDGSDYFAVIRDTDMPAVIVECAFVDHKTDVKLVDTKEEQKKMGYAVAKGILKTAEVKEQTVYKTLSAMNFRKEGKVDSTKIGSVPKGTLLTGTLKENNWLKTRYDGNTGYVRVKGQKEYCEKL